MDETCCWNRWFLLVRLCESWTLNERSLAHFLHISSPLFCFFMTCGRTIRGHVTQWIIVRVSLYGIQVVVAMHSCPKRVWRFFWFVCSIKTWPNAMYPNWFPTRLGCTAHSFLPNSAVSGFISYLADALISSMQGGNRGVRLLDQDLIELTYLFQEVRFASKEMMASAQISKRIEEH